MSLKTCNQVEGNNYELEVSVDAEVFSKAVNAEFKKQAPKINIPGFRKGKAPRSIIEKMYGKEVFYDGAVDATYQNALFDAEKEAGIKIVAVKNIDVQEVSDDGYTFKAEVIVEPEVEIKDYKGIEVEKKSTDVTDEMVEEEIKKVQERNSRMVTVEDRAAENGDTVVFDFEGFVDEVAFEGGKAENYNLELGSGNFIPGFEDQLVGHNSGEEFDINVKFPEDYQAENLKGKDAVFKIKLHEIKTKELPEVDDEFVKDVSEKETLAEYKDELKEQIKERLEHEAEHDVDDQITLAIINKVEGDIPQEMYKNEVNNIVRELDMRLRQQGMDLNTYMKYTGMQEENLVSMYQPEAENRVKLRLALEKIVKLENITPSEEDIEAEYKKMADMYKMDIEEVKKVLPSENLAEDLSVQKAMELVKDNAKIK